MNDDQPRIPYLPTRIEGLAAIATNLSWSWSPGARGLFAAVDGPLWHLTRHNPIELLRRADPARLAACADDAGFLEAYDQVVAALVADSEVDQSWYATAHPELGRRPIAYFCAEFGLHSSVPIYSGGLGVLAGDHCKAASDLGVPLVGVGLFYTKGYFDQRLRLDGWQEDSDARFDPGSTPLDRLAGPGGEPHFTSVRTFDREVRIAIWRMQVGRVPVFLLDTNLEENDPVDRDLSGKLYAGGPDLRLRQEWILGVGGVRALRAAGIDPAAWHANEGHAAFMAIERLRELTTRGTSFADAVREVRGRGIFTTHTPVPAGHDSFDREQVSRCTGPLWEELGISQDEFMGLGANPAEHQHLFHMTPLAIRLSSRVNGVARKHGEVSRQIWRPLWPGRQPDGVPISHVTNGVHLGTWMAAQIRVVIDEHLGRDWGERVDDPAVWDPVLEIDGGRLWAAHLELKQALISFIREEARRRWAEHWKEAAHIVGAGTLLDPEALTIGFARRFATYKRANLLFSDFDRLRELLTNPWRPVQIIFAGKAHPQDGPGKEVLQKVYSLTRDPHLEGRVAFIEDYDLHLAHRLVQGVDLWLNMPRAPLEACGTSGMKAGLNAVPQLSTLDGWWQEGYTGHNGWAIPPAHGEDDVDGSDAERLYSLLEEQVVPLYYQRDRQGIPRGWLDKMRHALHVAGARFTARRMVKQYVSEFYAPAIVGGGPGDDPPTA